jgi:hypothetical protein
MARRSILIAVLLLVGALSAPRPTAAWVNGGLGIVYGGPYPYAYPCPPPVACWTPGYYAPPVFGGWPLPYAAPAASWPSYGPDVAVRWNRYFAPEGPRVRGYTLPR